MGPMTEVLQNIRKFKPTIIDQVGSIAINIAKDPFSGEGTFRWPFYARLHNGKVGSCTIGLGSSANLVAKRFKDPMSTVGLSFLSQRLANLVAKRFKKPHYAVSHFLPPCIRPAPPPSVLLRRGYAVSGRRERSGGDAQWLGFAQRVESTSTHTSRNSSEGSPTCFWSSYFFPLHGTPLYFGVPPDLHPKPNLYICDSRGIFSLPGRVPVVEKRGGGVERVMTIRPDIRNAAIMYLDMRGLPAQLD